MVSREEAQKALERVMADLNGAAPQIAEIMGVESVTFTAGPPVKKPIPGPTGSTSRLWYFRGYQQAMRDIADAINKGGMEQVQEWVRNNTTA